MAGGTLSPCNVARGSVMMTLNWPGGRTLQCDKWLWDDMPLNSPKRPPYWNSTSGFDFNHIRESTCHSAPVCEILSKSDQKGQKRSKVKEIIVLIKARSFLDELNLEHLTS